MTLKEKTWKIRKVDVGNNFYCPKDVKTAIIDFNLLLSIYENKDELNSQEYNYFVETYNIYLDFNADNLEDYYKIIFGDFN